MRVFKSISFLVIVFGSIFQTSPDTYLQKGLELEKQGQPEEALKYWEGVIPELDHSYVALATEYLRVAAEYELTDYYNSASSIYFEEMSESHKTAFITTEMSLKRS